jgi:diacylglycerol kinase (ATP)
MTVEILSDLDRAERLAVQLYEQGRLRALVGAGGDGTLAELVNRTAPGTPLATYPAGTANLVARYVGATTRCHEFGQMLLDAAIVQFDAGRANGRLFMAVCSCGFDAEVVRQVHAARTGNITSLAYLMPLAATIGSYRFPELRIQCEATTDDSSPPGEIRARWAFVNNLPCYAAGLKPGIGACGTDGQLDLCTFRHGGLLPALRYLPHLLLGTQRDLSDCTIVRSHRIRIEASAEVPYEIDGDPGGMLPVDIDVLPNRLTLVVPRSFAEVIRNSGLSRQTRSTKTG